MSEEFSGAEGSAGAGIESGSLPSSGSDAPPDVQATFNEVFQNLGVDTKPEAPVQTQPAPVETPVETPVQPPINWDQRVQELGGWDQVQAATKLAQGFFSPLTDQYGNPVIDPTTGVPEVTTAPALEYLRQDSPQVFGRMMWESLELPLNDGSGETVGHSVLKEYYGISPQTLQLARQIEAGQVNAQQYIPQTVSQDELQVIPQEFHDVYKNLSSDTRAGLQQMLDDNARNQILDTYKQKMESDNVLKQVRDRETQIEQERAQNYRNQVENQASQYAVDSRKTVENAFKAEVQKLFKPFGDEVSNGRAYRDIAVSAELDMLQDPQTKLRMEGANQIAQNVVRLKAAGDNLRANQEQTRLTGELVWLYNRAMAAAKPHIEWWNSNQVGQRAATANQLQTAMGRREVAGGIRTGGSNGQPKPDGAGKYETDNIKSYFQAAGIDVDWSR